MPEEVKDKRRNSEESIKWLCLNIKQNVLYARSTSLLAGVIRFAEIVLWELKQRIRSKEKILFLILWARCEFYEYNSF